MKENVVVEKIDDVNASNLPESAFGVTLQDAENYGARLAGRRTPGFVNDPVRNVEKETLGDFMASELPKEDEDELYRTMKYLEGVLC